VDAVERQLFDRHAWVDRPRAPRAAEHGLAEHEQLVLGVADAFRSMSQRGELDAAVPSPVVADLRVTMGDGGQSLPRVVIDALRPAGRELTR
jgi:hypothetical protein